MTVRDKRPQDGNPETTRDTRTRRDRSGTVDWSDGGIIGLDIAMNYPERLDDLFARISGIWASAPNRADGQVAVITGPTAGVVGDHDEAILPETNHFAIPQATEESTAVIRALIDGLGTLGAP